MSKKPSSDYDPLTYGEIRLQPGQRGEAAAGAGNADDILFDDTPPAPASAQFGDASSAFTEGDAASWDLMEGDLKDYLPKGAAGESPREAGYSGSPLMTGPEQGADPPPAAAQAPGGIQGEMQRLAETAPGARATPQPKGRARAPQTSGSHKARSARQPLPPRKMALPRRRRSPAAVPVATVILAAGLGGAAWFWFQERNPVLAGVSGALGLIGALFTVILMRR